MAPGALLTPYSMSSPLSGYAQCLPLMASYDGALTPREMPVLQMLWAIAVLGSPLPVPLFSMHNTQETQGSQPHTDFHPSHEVHGQVIQWQN